MYVYIYLNVTNIQKIYLLYFKMGKCFIKCNIRGVQPLVVISTLIFFFTIPSDGFK